MEEKLQLKDLVKQYLENESFTAEDYIKSDRWLGEERITILWTSQNQWSTLLEEEDDEMVSIWELDDEARLVNENFEKLDTAYLLGALRAVLEYLGAKNNISSLVGKKYTREGMIRRVLDERMSRAKRLEYQVQLGKSRHGVHQLIHENGRRYNIVVWDFKQETGYIDNIDWRTNKLGTTKHLMFFFQYVKEHLGKLKRRPKEYPYIEITIDPKQDNQIRYFYNRTLAPEEADLLANIFGGETHLSDEKILSKYRLINKARSIESWIVRPEVTDKIERLIEAGQLSLLESRNGGYDYAFMKLPPYDYQKKGISFCIFKKSAILADEMGLGKTYQAIAIALLKQKHFDFKKTLVVSPASVKGQWQNEIYKFSGLKSIIIEGGRDNRAHLYLESNDDIYFYITNYESVRRDRDIINRAGFDFIILDEGQRIKNYHTRTAHVIKSLNKQHGLVLSGTPIENNLIDLYSIMLFLDPYALTPQWELSQQHCLFDPKQKNKIVGYYDLGKLKEKVAPYIVRRQKRDVLDELPQLVQQEVFVPFTTSQYEIHEYYKSVIAKILWKKYKTPHDWDVLMNSLTCMRMVCDSTYLIDKCTHHAPKIDELHDILINQLGILKSDRKVIIFSEWTTMLDIIESNLHQWGLRTIKLTGKVPTKKRQHLISTFNEDPKCQIFLSSEAGGSGLNLQSADTVINFELPWNPSKKNQRIGRIDRIGQKSNKIHVFNLVTEGSIEINMLAGLFMKQSLFDGVLDTKSTIETIDFSSEGRAQFIKQLEELVAESEENRIVTVVESSTAEEEDVINGEAGREENSLEELFDEESIPAEPLPEDARTKDPSQQMEELENVLQKGMEFLNGIYLMSTGQQMNKGNQPTLKVDRKTGEVTMKFKFDL